VAKAHKTSKTMRTTFTLLGILAAIALILHAAPLLVEMCTTFIADLNTYLEWTIEGQHMDGDMTMVVEGPVHQ